jgi:hypothetical protein
VALRASLEHRVLKFRLGHAYLVPEICRGSAAPFGYSSEVLPSVLRRPPPKSQSEDIGAFRHETTGQSGQFQEQRPDGSDRVVTKSFDRDNYCAGLDDRRNLVRHIEHLVVVGDQAVPPELTQANKQRPVIKIGETSVDLMETLHLYVDRKVRADSAYERRWEVLVECQA